MATEGIDLGAQTWCVAPGRSTSANTIVTGQNLNQLRQKHLRGVRALQTPAGSNIYRGGRLTRYIVRSLF